MLFLSGTQDEIIPREHMISLWGIAIGKLNPDGSPKKHSSPSDTSSSIPGEKNDERSVTGASQTERTETEPSPSLTAKVEDDGKWKEDDQDSKEHFDYESVNGVEVIVGRRTKYRFWREFEGGTHSEYRVPLQLCPNYAPQYSVYRIGS
jgi:hypothetical protein